MDQTIFRASQIRAEKGLLKQMAVGLRKEATPAERVLWGQLRGRRLQGLRFRRQHVLQGYIVDFYCHERRLCIELDGTPHHEPAQKMKDEQRDSELSFKGYRVLRVANDVVLNEMPRFLKSILDEAFRPRLDPPL